MLGSRSLSDKIKLMEWTGICSQGVEYTLKCDTILDKCRRLFLFVGLGNTWSISRSETRGYWHWDRIGYLRQKIWDRIGYLRPLSRGRHFSLWVSIYGLQMVVCIKDCLSRYKSSFLYTIHSGCATADSCYAFAYESAESCCVQLTNHITNHPEYSSIVPEMSITFLSF
jgi:hypothetical protein